MPESPESVPRKGKSCPICGKAVRRRSKTGRPPKYCSVKCSEEAARNSVINWKLVQQTKEGRKRCPTCGQLEPLNRVTRLPIVE